MALVSFASPKGGVGKTTLAAGTALALHRQGWRVLALDLDSQNALQLHFELENDELTGIADELDSGRDWTDLVVETPSGVYLIPFGAADAAGGMRLQEHATRHPGWVLDQLEPFFDYPDVVIVADMPPGPSVYHIEIDPLVDLRLTVLLADAASLALLPRLHAAAEPADSAVAATPRQPTGYVLNQVDPSRQLSRGVLELAQEVLGATLVGAVHHDEAVAEALACQSTILDYAPDSVAAHDILTLAQYVHRTLTAD